MLETTNAKKNAGSVPLSSKDGRILRPALALLLAAVTLTFYHPVLHNAFLSFDDSLYIVKNPYVQKGLTWETVKWAFSTLYLANWHPLTWLSHALDCQLFGLNPAGHHYVSLLLHAANAILVFFILDAATALVWPSFLAAALFALHPLNVESVAWAAERKNVLSMLFCLLALLAYTKYARSGKVRPYLWSLFFFALGLMAKPQIIPLPFLLLLWDYWPLKRMFAALASDTVGSPPSGRSISSLVLEKIPFIALAMASGVVAMIAQRVGGTVHSLQELSLAARVENTLVSYARYLADVFWPAKLAPLYPHPGNSLPVWQIDVATTVLLLITTAAIHYRGRRYLLTGWLWFLGSLIPTIGLIQIGEQAMADRYMYLPILGVLIAVVWGLRDFAGSRNISKVWIAIPAVLIIVVLGVATRRQVERWRDGETLWRYTLSVTKNNFMAHDNLGIALAEEGRSDEAINEFRAAEALHNYPAQQLLTLGAYEQRNSHLQGAIQQYATALSSTDDPAIKVAAWDQIASVYSQVKDWDHSRQAYESALAISPNDDRALLGTGLLAQRSGDTRRAVEQLSHALKVAPSDVAWLLLAGALRQEKKTADADAAYSEAQKLSRNFDETQKVASQIASSFGVTYP